MTDIRDRFRDLDALLAAVCEQTADGGDIQRIESLAGDAQGLDYVLDYLQLDALLRWEYGAGMEEAGSGEEIGGGEEDSGFRVQGSFAENQRSIINNQQSSSPPIILDLSPAPYSPLFTLHSPVGAFLFSYLMGALLLGIGLLLGLEWRISRDPQVVHSPGRQTPKVARPVSEAPLVARVTGTADCVWTDPKTEVFDRDGVSLGRQLRWHQDGSNSPTTQAPRSSLRDHAPTRSNRPAAASSRSAN